MRSPSNSTTSAGRGGRLTRLIERLRAAVLGALADENDHAAYEARMGDDRDLFDKLPDPPPHLEIGDIKHFDGKFRYF